MSAEKPILFSDAMVRAILEGRKDVTRRLIGLDKLQPSTTPGYAWTWRGRAPVKSIAQQRRYAGGCWQDVPHERFMALCPWQPGDLLYVREAWAALDFGSYEEARDIHQTVDVRYRATEPLADCTADVRGYRWRPSIHMLKRFARLWLRVVSVRAERLQDMTEEDAKREGAEPNWTAPYDGWKPQDHGYLDPADPHYPDGCECSNGLATARDWFAALWDSINGDRDGASWAANPWVWRVEFKREARA